MTVNRSNIAKDNKLYLFGKTQIYTVYLILMFNALFQADYKSPQNPHGSVGMEDHPHTHPIPIPMGIPMWIPIHTADLPFRDYAESSGNG